jgi:TrmH family RNA methyltransferase
MITSSQNAKLKQARALLGRSRERREAGAFVVEGVRLAEEALRAGWPLRFVLYTAEVSSRGMELIEAGRARGIEAEEVSAQLMQSISETETSQGTLAVVERTDLTAPPAPDFILILDQLRDPGNLGTLLRSADAAGVQAVLLAPGTADAFAPKVVRAGMGAHFRLPVLVRAWEQIAEIVAAAGLQVLIADMHGAACWKTDLRVPLALIVGGEAQGAGERARGLATQGIAVPMSGRAESLNAAVAGSILMFEVERQRWETTS